MRSARRAASLLLTLCLMHCGAAILRAGTRPAWVGNTPTATGSATRYVETVTYAADMASARTEALNVLAQDRQLMQTVRIALATDKKRTVGQHFTGGRLKEDIAEQTTVRMSIDGKEVTLRAMFVDSWHRIRGGQIELHTLYQVAVTPDAAFDDVRLSTRYGAAATVRSIVPGLGQMYKGQHGKGWSIIAGEAVAVAGIIVGESQRSSWQSKMDAAHSTTLIKDYRSRRDQWATVSGVSIGAAAAIYVYNLIDAAAAPGARRVVARPARYALTPSVSTEGVGLSLAINF